MTKAEINQLVIDASRYRWLRDQGDLALMQELIDESSAGWDMAIDEAMNELAFMPTGMYGKPLPPQNGGPIRIIAPVVIALSTSLVAVPAFMRVDPVTASGPVTGTMARDTWASTSAGGGEQARIAVFAPFALACCRAART